MHETAIQVFQYHGSNVTFNQGDSVMVNATEMAKPFGKRPVDWLKTQQAQELVKAICEVKNLTSADLLKVSKGGNAIQCSQGTWMQEDVALAFAQWLAPIFYVWCNDRIKELLTKGITATTATIEDILADPDVGIRLLTEIKRARLAQQVAETKLAEARPKLDYYDRILQSRDAVTVSQIAKDYGMSAKKLNAVLAGFGIQYKCHGQWLLYSQFAGNGYTVSRTNEFVHSNGEPGCAMHTLWTQKGRLFLYDLLKANGILPLIESEPESAAS